MPHRPSPRRLSLVVVALAAVAAACAPPPVPPPGWSQVSITRDGADVTTITESKGVMSVHAPRTNVGSDSRTFFHRNAAPLSTSQASCATTDHSGMPVQEGVALRVAPSRTGQQVGTKAITVQKNIYAGVDWVYNVHLWDTSRPGREGYIGSSIALVAGVEMGSGSGVAKRARRLCARVRGDVVEFKVWPPSGAEPAWDDPVHARSVKLPAGWVYQGRPGLYIGHVPPGGWATFSGLHQAAT